MSLKNSNDNIGNRTRDLPACSAVPQPTALPCALYINCMIFYCRGVNTSILTLVGYYRGVDISN